MAVPFNFEEDSTEELLTLCQRIIQELYLVLRHIIQQQEAAAAAATATAVRCSARSRLPSCEEAAAEDEYPSTSELRTEQLRNELPDVVPRAVTSRQWGPASTPRVGASATPSTPVRRRTSSNISRTTSAFTKYLMNGGAGDSAGTVSALATSDTTACFALPLEDQPSEPCAPCLQPGLLPDLVPDLLPPGACGACLPPSPAPRRSKPLPQPLPRRKRRLRKAYREAGEEDLEKALFSKMAAGAGLAEVAGEGRFHCSLPGPWMRVGEDLRHIADEFSNNLKPRDEVDSVTEKSLLSLLLPQPVKGTIWTTVVLLVGWRLLSRMR